MPRLVRGEKAQPPNERTKVVGFAAAHAGKGFRRHNGIHAAAEGVFGFFIQQNRLVFRRENLRLQRGRVDIHLLHRENFHARRQRRAEAFQRVRGRVPEPKVCHLAAARKSQRQRGGELNFRLRMKSLAVFQAEFRAARGALPNAVEVEMPRVAQRAPFGKEKTKTPKFAHARLPRGRTSGHFQTSPGFSRRRSLKAGKMPHA